VPRRFRFRHPLVRRAVYESAPGGWRLGAHERCADALAALGATAADRAHHVHRSARRGDSAAIAILREAGEAAAQRAPASAATWFANALDLLPDAAPAEMRVELLLARSSALAATGHFPESHAALVDALSFVPEDSLALRVRLTAACAAAEHLLRHHDQAHARLARALDDLANSRSPEAVELMIELALDSRHRTEYEQMRQWSVRGLETARSLADKPLIAAAVALVSVADAFAGAISDAEAHRLEAATLVDEMSDSVLALRLDAISSLATAELYLDRYQEACTHSERAIAVARATGQVGRVPYLSPTLGSARVYRGQLREAAEVLNDGVEATRLSHDLQGLAWNLLNGSSAALASGDLETALVTAQESVDLTSEFGRTLIAVRARAVWAAALLESGEPARAIDALVDSAGGEELPFLPGGWRSNRLELLTRCCLAVDRVGDGARAAAEAEACAAAYELPMATAMAHRAAAAVALHYNHPEIAAERALASAAAADEIAAPIEAAVSRTLAGRALARAGRTDSAAAELERAAAELHALGATRYRAEAEQELRKLGRRIHRRTRAGEADGVGVETLTERELQVARLVVDRKTNREIAEGLFLSPKTVETHLRNIFRKLGVANRVELARAVEHAERVGLSGS
jgi:DNA-binding CsgD family transcriptional regulator